MTAIELLLVLGLAQRLTRLFVYDKAGLPFVDVAVKLFERVGGDRGLSLALYLFSCPFCLGWWMSLASAVLWAAFGHTTAWFVIALAATVSYVIGHVSVMLDETD